VRFKLIGLYTILIAANIAAWAAALALFRNTPLLLGTALLAYSFGLRHAVDADHIAAIDNITRKLIQDGKQPVGIGFFFSLGHSTIVACASFVVAATAATAKTRFDAFQGTFSIIGTSVSALILLTIAVMNIVILAGYIGPFGACGKVRRM
jgi:high-affinity nickel-transport protein